MLKKSLKIFLILFLFIAPFVCCCSDQAFATEIVKASAFSNLCPTGEKCCDEGEAACLDLNQSPADLSNVNVSWERGWLVGAIPFENAWPTPVYTASINHLLFFPPPSGVPLFIQHRSLRL